MKKKPRFKRQDLILNKLKDKWVRPRGIHSKLRLARRGKGKRPKIGYGNDKKLKYSQPTYVKNIYDLINAKQQIIISSTVGLKKKLDMINKAKELKLQIINIKDIDNFIEKVKKEQEEKKKSKITKDEKKKKQEKSKKEQEETKDEKEKRQKEEKRKVLEKGI